MLYLRPVDAKDVELLFTWANDPDVRKHSFNTNKIIWEDHEKWFHKKILSDSIWLILQKEDTPLGVIRFDLLENSFLLNYSIGKQFRGSGYGKKIIELGSERLAKQNKKVNKIEAHVKTNNIASQKIFDSLGFEKVLLGDEYIFTREL
ncbi:MAG: GNAT family N-acetyltransferase [Leptospiraceae bacterium]|nr:GNAT family N-acetyltransferase [Leptospiraceae bacterium]